MKSKTKIIIKTKPKVKKQEVFNAIIEDNKVYCAICKEHNYQICDLKLVEHKGIKLNKFIMRCTCGALNKFCSNITMEAELHSIINDDELSEVKEEIEGSENINA